MSDYQQQFNEFVNKISIPDTQQKRMQDTYDSLETYLGNCFSLGVADIFLQGSYPNGTAVVPTEGGEYDIDVIVACAEVSDDANSALQKLEDALGASRVYNNRIKPKKPCVRLEYAEDNVGKFHVDITPVRLSHTAPFEAPRRAEGWHDTAPAEYTEWCRERGELFARTVKTLKRWRDEQQDVRIAVKSILLQVMAAEHMPQLDNDSERLAATLRSISDALATATTVPVVTNPVLPAEDLARRWSQNQFNDFRTHVGAAADLAERALAADDETTGSALWHELLGEDFPLVTGEQAGIILADTSHAKGVTDMGWGMALAPGATVEINAMVVAENKMRQIFKRYPSNGPLLMAKWKVRFQAQITTLYPVEIWWQVINTGGHARSLNGLRGEFFKSKLLDGSDSPDPTINWEDTSYTGSHIIECFLVKNNTVVARSGQFYVNVKNPGRRFFR